MFLSLFVFCVFCEGYTVKLNKETGEVIWDIKTDPETLIIPLINETLIYVSSFRDGIIALDKESGDVVFNSKKKNNQAHTEIMSYQGVVFYGNQDRELISIQNDGIQKRISSFEYGIGIPILYNEELYIMDGNGAMFKINSY